MEKRWSRYVPSYPYNQPNPNLILNKQPKPTLNNQPGIHQKLILDQTKIFDPVV